MADSNSSSGCGGEGVAVPDRAAFLLLLLLLLIAICCLSTLNTHTQMSATHIHTHTHTHKGNRATIDKEIAHVFCGVEATRGLLAADEAKLRQILQNCCCFCKVSAWGGLSPWWVERMLCLFRWR